MTIEWGWSSTGCAGYSLQLFAFKKTSSSGSYDGSPIGRVNYPNTSIQYTIPSNVTEIYFKGTLYNDRFGVVKYYQTDPVKPAEPNSLPHSPSSISVSPSSQISDGGRFNLSWSTAYDPDGDSVTYEVTAEYTKTDGGAENVVIYSGSSTSYSFNLPSGKYKSVRFKVRSKDSKGAFSPSYAYTGTVTVIDNRPPTYPGTVTATISK